MKVRVPGFVARTTLAILAVSLGAAGIGIAWFYSYSGDIPGMASIATFAPNETASLYDQCSETSVRAVTFRALGNNLLNAFRAAEGYDERTLSLQIARRLFCNHDGDMVERHLLEYKAAAQLREKFKHSQLLTIYLNRASFGDGGVGVANASQHFYRKQPADLNVSEAAMIAALIKAPQFYSPTLHPDRAKERRDAVIAVMLKLGTITERDAQEASQAPVTGSVFRTR